MRNKFRLSLGLAAVSLAALALSSCDPYYTGGSYYGGSYTSGYGSGYGYGNPGFSTSLFVSTGNARWGYDPSCYSYYDYTRRCYYDPYLYSYYPVGYRPQVVVGVPHPHGYRRNYCPPPARVTNARLVNYQHRDVAYRNSGQSWARNVRQQNYSPPPRNHNPQQAQPRGSSRSQGGSAGFWGNSPQSGSSSRSRGAANSGYRSTPPQSGSSSRSQGGTSGFWGGSSQPQRASGNIQAPPRSGSAQPGGSYNRNSSGTRQPSSGLPRNYNVPVRTPAPSQRGLSAPPRRSSAPSAPSRIQQRQTPAPQPAQPSRRIQPSQPSQPSASHSAQRSSPAASGAGPARARDVRSAPKARR
ncbi:MAG: hypothetical protein K9N23_07755 [Akkermansiaceae bacterium]|nr:hypothetical protein [Akkermansiaceae bacterium]MCF7731566.1 hypothetical protein [Akkermansiaceae bacterium]